MFKVLIEKITSLFAQPRAGVVVPVEEKVEKVMNAPYKIDAPVEWPFPSAEKPAEPVVQEKKVPAKKRTYKKKTQA